MSNVSANNINMDDFQSFDVKMDKSSNNDFGSCMSTDLKNLAADTTADNKNMFWLRKESGGKNTNSRGNRDRINSMTLYNEFNTSDYKQLHELS